MELGSALSAGFLISDCDLDADDAELDSVVGTVIHRRMQLVVS